MYPNVLTGSVSEGRIGGRIEIIVVNVIYWGFFVMTEFWPLYDILFWFLFIECLFE